MSLRISTAEFTRPADAIAYASGDAVADSTSAPTILTFPNVVDENGGLGVILSGVMKKSGAGVSNATFRLHLYSGSVTPTNDNAPLSIAYADRAKYLGYLTFALQAAGSGMAFAVGTAVQESNGAPWPLPFACTDAADHSGDDIFGLLEVRGAYTPVSGEQFSISLVVEQAD
jgi:hypothetical protein